MWGQQIIQQVILGLIGLSAGITVAGGLFSFIIELGILSDFADRTHTGEHILLYEDAAALGGILGNIFFVFQISIPGGTWILPLFGILAGMFAGCWAMALAEILNLFPVFMRRFNLVNCLAGIILGIAAGKTLGCIWILLQEAK